MVIFYAVFCCLNTEEKSNEDTKKKKKKIFNNKVKSIKNKRFEFSTKKLLKSAHFLKKQVF